MQKSTPLPKIPPHSIEAEQAVLGTLMINNAVWASICGNMVANDFYLNSHKVIFSTISKLATDNLPFDPIVLSERLKRTSQLEQAGGESYLFEIAASNYSIANIEAYATIINELSRKRQLLNILEDTSNKCYGEEKSDSIINYAATGFDAKVSKLFNDRKKGLVSIDLPSLIELDIPKKDYLLTPWMAAQSISMLHAYRGTGKTFISLGVAYAVASGGRFLNWRAPEKKGVLILDGEMPLKALQDRFKAIVNKGDELAPVRLISPDLQTMQMPDISTIQGQENINQHITDDISLIIIDNLSTLARSGKENEADSWDIIQAWALKLRSLGKSILFIHHSGKSGQQRGTSKREDILDTVISLKRPPTAKEEGAIFELHFEKARGFYGKEAEPMLIKMVTVNDKNTWVIKSLEQYELENILELHKGGLSQRQISEELQLSQSTVCRRLKTAADSSLYSSKGVYYE